MTVTTDDSETLQQPLTPLPDYPVMPVLTQYDLAAIRRIVREELKQALTLEKMAQKLKEEHGSESPTAKGGMI